uniref:Uncharacterized protein n=1 Tax=Oryza sativa subsp. japonica TaxID=39947 RepID=Q69MQ0_ORYSJ|nr:hypothetical protein [Oryza sativa Japonica Group]
MSTSANPSAAPSTEYAEGPMTPTLIDIIMITGLDVTSSANPMSLNTKNQYDFKTKSIGGWSGYVAAYMGQGSVTPREHKPNFQDWSQLQMTMEKSAPTGDVCPMESMHLHQPTLEQSYRLNYSRNGSVAFMKASRKMLEFGSLMKIQQTLNSHRTLDLKMSIMKDIKSPGKSSQLQLAHASFLSASIREETSKPLMNFIIQ